RKNLLGEADSSRLATSPVLSNLATGVTGLEASQKINDLFLGGGKRAAPEPLTHLTVPLAGDSGGGGGGGGGAGPLDFGFLAAGVMPIQPLTFNFSSGVANAFAQAQNLSLLTADFAAKETFLGTTSLTSAAVIGSDFTNFKVDLADAKVQASTIAWQGLVYGKASPVRTITVGERLRPSPAQEAKNAAVATKAEIARGVQDLGLNLSGLLIPLSGRRTALVEKDAFEQSISGLPNPAKNIMTDTRAIPVAGDVFIVNEKHVIASAQSLSSGNAATAKAIVEVTATLLARRADLDLANLSGLILADHLDPDPADPDEGAYYAAAVDALESAVSMLRLIELRIHDYTSFLDRVRDTLIRLYDLSEAWQGAIDDAAADLAEATHDKTVAMALWQEENDRVDAINQRRADILEKNVEIIAFARPRSLDRFADVPGMDLYAPLEDPIPACLEGGDPPAEELQEMVDNLREAPVGWFPSLAAEVDRINRPHYFIDVWRAARRRAEVWLERVPERTKVLTTTTDQRRVAGKAATGVRLALAASYSQISHVVAVKAARPLDDLTALSWLNLRERVSKELSIDDLAGAGPAGARLNRRGLRELGQIASVTACFLATLRETPTTIRLQWAETLSVHDDPPDLFDITRAVGWTSLPFEQRRVLEHMHRWLFARIDRTIDEARRAMSEIVRVCLLLASHAPVSEIVEGTPAETKTLAKDETFEVAIGKGAAAIGMVASFAGGKAGLGVVKDIIGAKALVQVTYAPGGQVAISPSEAVRFTNPMQMQLMAGR
ncbi:MAG: hypothetical protein OEU92_16195, partial [Alphaproteobacteria bacterium]|nr:hypothetical protein [Alphaproteobacteria bacterium]